MTSGREHWHRARTLFDELVDLDPDTRAARLRVLQGEDASLTRTVQRLLAADDGAESALRAYSFGSPGGAAATAASRDPLGVVGQTVSHFRVTAHVASGGMGAVYAAEDVQLGRTVALKFPLPHQHVDRAVAARFVNEARTAAALDHPNLCTVHEIGECEHGLFLAMPLYSGETLRDRLDREGALPPGEALDILTPVVTGLASAHDAGIVHRDLKPANVMLLADGSVKVLDFGLAKIRDVDLTRSRVALGTIGYVAPEQITGSPVDARTDLWAIGVMLYEMLTGVRPFRGDHEMSVLHAVLHEDPPSPTELGVQLPPPLDDLVGALLQKDPAARYQSADALLADLQALKRGAPFARRTPFWARTRRRRRTRAALLPSALALILVPVVGWAVYRGLGARPGAQGTASAVLLRWRGDSVEIGTVAELHAALVPANAGRSVRLRAGTYEITRPLVVPDGMRIEGGGVMQFGADGLPTGFEEGTQATIRMTGSVGGEVFTLGDGVTLRGLQVDDLAGRSGNVVAVSSRAPGDTVTASIVESMIVNPNPYTVTASGALGRGLRVVTLNPNLGSGPAPHEGAVLSVTLTRSMIGSPGGGGGFFAFNFAANSRISLVLSRSVIGGTNEANAGVSRPDAVHDSRVTIVSTGNLYRDEWADPCVSPLVGWNFTGGSGAPVPLTIGAAERNLLHVRSVNDRLEGFTTAIFATGGRSFFAQPLNAPPSDNTIDLQLRGTRITTPDCGSRSGAAGGADNSIGLPESGVTATGELQLYGARVNNNALHPGFRNTVRVDLRDVTGSGARANFYFDAGGPSGALPAQYQRAGNRLEITGDLSGFVRSNRGIVPPPGAAFFRGLRAGRAAPAAP